MGWCSLQNRWYSGPSILSPLALNLLVCLLCSYPNYSMALWVGREQAFDLEQGRRSIGADAISRARNVSS